MAGMRSWLTCLNSSIPPVSHPLLGTKGPFCTTCGGISDHCQRTGSTGGVRRIRVPNPFGRGRHDCAGNENNASYEEVLRGPGSALLKPGRSVSRDSPQESRPWLVSILVPRLYDIEQIETSETGAFQWVPRNAISDSVAACGDYYRPYPQIFQIIGIASIEKSRTGEDCTESGQATTED